MAKIYIRPVAGKGEKKPQIITKQDRIMINNQNDNCMRFAVVVTNLSKGSKNWLTR